MSADVSTSLAMLAKGRHPERSEAESRDLPTNQRPTINALYKKRGRSAEQPLFPFHPARLPFFRKA
jgi:hypothetical protein